MGRQKVPLNPQHEKAVNYYMRGLSKHDALVKSGYSEITASRKSSKIFGRQDVQDEIYRRQKLMADKAQIDSNWIVDRLKNIADANIGDMIVFDGKGNPSIDYSLMSDEMRKSIGEFSSETYTEGRGKDRKPFTRIKIKQADKLRALEMLGKYLGMFQDQVNIKVEEDIISKLQAGRERVRVKLSSPEVVEHVPTHEEL